MNFIIKKGKHYAEGLKLGFQVKKSVYFTATFDNSCLYQDDSTDGKDINKLYGMSDGIDHMNNSIRIGWRSLNNKDIEIFAYAHNDGKLNYQYITTVKVDREIGFRITIKKDVYMINVICSGYTYVKTLKRTSKWFLPFRYILYFYFGGNLIAPQDMKVKITDHNFKFLLYVNI